MPKIDINAAPVRTGSTYPAPYDQAVAGRSSRRLGEAGGLTQYGANLVTLEPGAKASLRHWHEEQDELLWMTDGVLVLVDDTGETEMVVGDAAAFPAGDANGHHMVNKSDEPGSFLVIGTHTRTETAHYSDVDMMVTTRDGVSTFTRRDGSEI